MKVSDYIIKRLEETKSKHMFMLPGGGAMHLNDSLGNSNIIKYVTCLHEQACSIAAESYARVTNTPGLLMVTTGPGGTNAITGVAGAYLESTPMIIISGQVKTQDMIEGQKIRQQGMQELSIIDVVNSITKYAVSVTNKNDIKKELDIAIYEATHGRKGPVWLDIPLDVQASEIDIDSLNSADLSNNIKNNTPKYTIDNGELKEKVKEVFRLLKNKKRPCFLIGNGIRLSDSKDKVNELISLLKVPVLTTWNGIDLVTEDNPYYFGRPGGLGHRYANFIQQNSDLYISIGARLNLLQTGFNFDGFAKNAIKVQVDIDEGELNKKNVRPDIKINACALEFIDVLIDEIKNDRINIDKINISDDRKYWLDYCNDVKKAFPLVTNEMRKDGVINPYYLLEIISKYIDEDAIYVSGSSGSSIDISMQTLKIKGSMRAYSTKGLASMGYGLPSTIGASFASGNKQVVSVQGDGGFMMNIQDLATIKGNNLNIKIFVLCNDGYGAIKATQTNVFNKHFVSCDKKSGLNIPNIEEVVKGFNIKTLNIYKNEEAEDLVKKAFADKEPTVICVHSDISVTAFPKQTNYKDENGQMKSLTLDFMAPKISEELQKKYTII